MSLRSLVQFASQFPPQRARAAVGAIVAANETQPETLAAFTRRAAEAFERDMQPVVEAVVSALQAGDVEALRDLRAALPDLLEKVNEAPALADLLAHQLGKAFMDGLRGGAAE